MAEEVCNRCKHARRSHSRNGCTDFDGPLSSLKECKCKVKNQDKGSWHQGTPKKDW